MVADLTAMTIKILLEKGVESNSEVIRSIQFEAGKDGLKLMALDYYEYLSTGRKKGGRKVPIESLIEWIKKYNIASGNINQVAYRIQRKIFLKGINGKGYALKVEDVTTEYVSEELAEQISEVIAEDLSEALTATIII